MANWFYYDNDTAEKRGPIDNTQLKILTANGTITPETYVETEDGRKGQAKNIKGLNFPPPAWVPVSPLESGSGLRFESARPTQPPEANANPSYLGQFFNSMPLIKRVETLPAAVKNYITLSIILAVAGIPVSLVPLVVNPTSPIAKCTTFVQGFCFLMETYLLVIGYKMTAAFWRQIPPDIARITPATAGWLNVIPVVCFYGWFKCWGGLMEDMNKTAAVYGRPKIVEPAFGYGICLWWIFSVSISAAIPADAEQMSAASIPSLLVIITDCAVTCIFIHMLHQKAALLIKINPSTAGQTAAVSFSQTNSNNKAAFWVQSIIMGVLVGTCLLTLKAIQERNTPIEITAGTLIGEWRDNGTAANAKYTGNNLAISGTVAEITTSTTGVPAIIFGDMFFQVQCFCRTSQTDAVSQLVRGQQVTIHGNCTGLMDGHIRIDDCKLTEVKDKPKRTPKPINPWNPSIPRR